MVGDQSAEIDAHDLVYRTTPLPPFVGRGTRTDMVFLNAGGGRSIYNDDQAAMLQSIEPATWWVFKSKTGFRKQGKWRHARRPPKIINPNQVTQMLWDLHYEDVQITVYGADLYASGPQRSYQDGYRPWDKEGIAVGSEGFLIHRPFEQMSIHRMVHATGKVKGDDRYLAAVTMTDQEYQAVIDSWAAALEEARA